MTFSETELYDFLKKAFDLLSSSASGYGGLGLMIVAAFVGISVLKKMIFKKGSSGAGGLEGLGGGESAAGSKAESSSSAESETADTEGRAEAERPKTPEQMLQEKENEKKKESLEELFDLFSAEARKERRIEKPEEQELESLGLNKQLSEDLRRRIDELIQQIAGLMEKGLTDGQIAKALTSRSGSEIPLMELQPLIEALNCFLNSEYLKTDKEIAVIGIDPDFERKAAYSALMRGDYDEAFAFLERAAEKAENRAASSRRGDVKKTCEQEAAEIYRSIAALARPVNMEKSFEALQKSRNCAPKDTLTSAMIGRAYYESGKTKQAQKVFEDILTRTDEAERDYPGAYALGMLPQIRSERTMLHARRIRENYEQRLDEALGTHERAPQDLMKDFAAREIRERAADERAYG
ncbi:MAG: tetratricopeptide repeat protein [Alphaproteobacteria bacterium]